MLGEYKPQRQCLPFVGHTWQQFSPSNAVPVGGGDIIENYFLHGEDQKYFVKINRRHHQLFAVEAQALEQVQASHTIRVPAVVAGYRSSCVRLINSLLALWQH